MNCLLVVDPQIDFINGSLPVPGAEDAMEELAAWLPEQNYTLKIVTLDFHPYDHSSFKDEGGLWPIHCVAHSNGAAIWPTLLPALYASPGDVHIFCKGTDKSKEEYSIFQNEQALKTLKDLLNSVQKIDICGIAGDICVLNTLKEGIALFGREKFNLIERFAPSLDGGKALKAFMQRQ